MTLCHLCRKIRPRNIVQAEGWPHYGSLQELVTSAETCELCALFLSKLPSASQPANSQLFVFGDGHNFGGPPRSVGIPYQGLSLRYIQLSLASRSQERAQGAFFHSERLDVFAESGSPVAASGDVIGRPVKAAGDTAQVREWLDICRTQHSCLSAERAAKIVLPTRVLDVSGHDGEGDPSLVESNDALGEYVALSHRWGSAMIIQTTKSNLSSHKQAIPFGQLCATFRDAVTFTRKLGYRYLWIDSLCIIQDDHEDWKREAARMADVYRNAVMTLSATCATSGDTGLFHVREECSVVEMPYFTVDGARNSSYYISNRSVHDFQEEVMKGPLNTRAWVLQERNLSPRTLHFGTTQRLWECQESAWEESCILECLCDDRFGNGPHGFGGYSSCGFVGKFELLTDRSHRWADYIYSTKYLYPMWYHMVENYMRRSLTKESDKLHAISGLARVFGSFVAVYKQDRYVAGLWENDFANGLMWCSQAQGGLHRPLTKRAPSWSWVAWEGPISYIEVPSHVFPEMKLEDIALLLGSADADEFGLGQSVAVRLTGYLAPVRSSAYQPSAAVDMRSLGYPKMGHINMTLLDSNKKPVGCGWLDETSEEREKLMYCLLVFKTRTSHQNLVEEFLWCLLLEEVGINLYERVGLAQVYQWIFRERDKGVVML